MTRFVAGIFAASLIVLGAEVASGQTYPHKPIRIVTAEPGGVSDFVARLIAQGISGPLGQPVIIDNRSSLVSPDVVAKAPPNGYTVLLSGPSLWIWPLLQSTPYDPLREFAPKKG